MAGFECEAGGRPHRPGERTGTPSVRRFADAFRAGEEEKARREYERALKEAAKEEELLRKAMEKALLKV